jgi:hypothetical protein
LSALGQSDPPGRNGWHAPSVLGMYLGFFLFAAIAILCVVVGATAMKRNRDYGNSEGDADDFDFDKFEGFDK